MFLTYWFFGLRLPTLGFVGHWVELGLGAEMRNSVRPHSDEYSLESEVLLLVQWFRLRVPLQELQPDPGLMNQDPASRLRRRKKKQKRNKQKTEKQ